MNLAYDNTFKVASESPENALLDKKRSELILEIHKYVDFDSIPLQIYRQQVRHNLIDRIVEHK